MNKLKLTLILAFTLPLSATAAVSTVHKDFKAEKGTLLSVRSINGDIAITQGAAGAVSADITYDAEKCEVISELRGNTVYFEAKHAKAWKIFSFGFSSNKESCAKFVIKAPAGMETNPVSVSGNVLVERLNGPVTGKTVSGDVSVAGPGPLSLTTVSGSIKVSEAAGKMRFHTTSGNISGNIKSSEDLEAHSVSGKIAFDVLTAPAKGAFSLDTVSGDLQLTFPKGAKASASFQSVSGDQKNNIINDPAAAFRINAKTTSGDLTINSK
jgi:DUF4097 and DUF4098 domain-containing protein YvlB